jgi:hypothetical protein
MEQSDSHPHPSVQALLGEALPGENAHAVIRRKARAIVAKHRSLWTGPPFCPFTLVDLEGIIVEQATCDIRSDGRIFSKGKQVYIQYAEGQSQERVRFTICHELAHTLFPDCYTRERQRSPAEQAEWEFENLCNIAAAEFLFPIEEFTEDIGAGQLSAEQIKNLAGRYHASVDATARRYVTTCQVPACILFAQYREPTGGKVVSLFGQYSVPNEKFPQKFFKGFKINSKSVANRAHKEQQPLGSRRENWMVAGKWCSLRVEAIPLPKFASKETADLALVLYPA